MIKVLRPTENGTVNACRTTLLVERKECKGIITANIIHSVPGMGLRASNILLIWSLWQTFGKLLLSSPFLHPIFRNSEMVLYLLLHNELPQNLKQQTLLLCYSFCESGIWLSSVALSSRSRMRLQSRCHLKGWPELEDLLPTLLHSC